MIKYKKYDIIIKIRQKEGIMSFIYKKEIAALLMEQFSEKEIVEKIVDEFEQLHHLSKIEIVESNTEDDETQNLNMLRLGNCLYISLAQLRENIKKNWVGIILNIFLSGGELNVGCIQSLPHILSTVHFITDQERCVFLRAIELLKYDGQFHPIEDYSKNSSFNADCNNLDIDCYYRHKEICKMTLVQLNDSLDSLVDKNILERNSINEYRYCKW